MAQTVKSLPSMRETWVRSLGWKDPLEKEMATHSSILTWKIPWREEPARLQSMGSQRVGHDWVTSVSSFLRYKLAKTVHIVWTSIKRADVKERDRLPSRESEYQSECRNETNVDMKDCNSLGTGMPRRSL